MDCRKLTYWNKAEVKVLTTGKTEKNGCSRYELTNHLTNHLTNVLSVVTDRRTGVCGMDTSASGDTLVAFYNADIISATDYYPFGMQMPGRKFISSSSGYRFGFNGQEMDNEIYGEGNSYTAQFWQYDPRLGRRWNVDPLAKKYPYNSPYIAFGDNPILIVDNHGDSIYIASAIYYGTNTAINVLYDTKLGKKILNYYMSAPMSIYIFMDLIKWKEKKREA